MIDAVDVVDGDALREEVVVVDGLEDCDAVEDVDWLALNEDVEVVEGELDTEVVLEADGDALIDAVEVKDCVSDGSKAPPRVEEGGLSGSAVDDATCVELIPAFPSAAAIVGSEAATCAILATRSPPLPVDSEIDEEAALATLLASVAANVTVCVTA